MNLPIGLGRVSVVIPTHERPEKLRRALTSVRRQSEVGTEVIVVDDSPHHTGYQPTAEFGAQYLSRPATAGTTAGPARSRNAGASLATGDILAFLDDDDQWRPGYLKHLVTALREGAADAVVGALLQTRSGTESLHRLHRDFDIARLRPGDPDWYGTGISGSNFVVTRSAFSAVGGYDETLTMSEDWDLAARVAASGARIGYCRHGVAVQDLDGTDHLTAKSARNEVAVDRYLAKHAGRLTRSQRRQLLAFRSAQGRRVENGTVRRVSSLVRQVYYETWPRRLQMARWLTTGQPAAVARTVPSAAAAARPIDDISCAPTYRPRTGRKANFEEGEPG